MYWSQDPQGHKGHGRFPRCHPAAPGGDLGMASRVPTTQMGALRPHPLPGQGQAPPISGFVVPSAWPPLRPTLTPASLAASAFSPSLFNPPPQPGRPTWGVSDDRWATTAGWPLQGGDAGPGRGDSCRYQAPEEAAAPADLRQLCRGPSAGGCPGCARRAVHPVPGLLCGPPGAGPPSGSGNPIPAKCLLG